MCKYGRYINVKSVFCMCMCFYFFQANMTGTLTFLIVPSIELREPLKEEEDEAIVVSIN